MTKQMLDYHSYDLKEHWKNCHNGNEPIEIQEDNFDEKAYLNLE